MASKNIFIEIGIDRTTYPKFCFEVWEYEYFGNWTRLDKKEEFNLYLTEYECLNEALKIALKSLKMKKLFEVSIPEQVESHEVDYTCSVPGSIRLPLKFIWEPKEDITTFELAQCLPFILNKNVNLEDHDKYVFLRHFKIEEIKI